MSYTVKKVAFKTGATGPYLTGATPAGITWVEAPILANLRNTNYSNATRDTIDVKDATDNNAAVAPTQPVYYDTDKLKDTACVNGNCDCEKNADGKGCATMAITGEPGDKATLTHSVAPNTGIHTAV